MPFCNILAYLLYLVFLNYSIQESVEKKGDDRNTVCMQPVFLFKMPYVVFLVVYIYVHIYLDRWLAEDVRNSSHYTQTVVKCV